MENQGLAEVMSSNPTGAGQSNGQDIAEIVQLLMQGASPDELLAMGVPEEIIEQAMQMIQARQQGQMQQQQGLANSMMA